MGIKTSGLTRQDDIANNDLIVFVSNQNAATRVVTLTNYTDSQTDLLVNNGFINTNDLPAALINNRSVLTITGGLNIDFSIHDLVLADCSSTDIQVALPLASSAFDTANSQGKFFTLKKIDTTTNKVTVTTTGVDLIEGVATLELLGSDRPSVNIQSDGTGWWLTD